MRELDLRDPALVEEPIFDKADDWSFNDPSHYDQFQYNLYDWFSKGFTPTSGPGYAVILLSQGYFALVRKRGASKYTRHKWYANVQRNPDGTIKKIYAARTIKRRGKKICIYLHREVLNAGKNVIVDHTHGHSLDCRDHVLKVTTHKGNRANSRRGRSTNLGLKMGVEVRKTPKGLRYGGQIKIKGKTYRSAVTWSLTPEGEERAHRWYVNRHKETYSHRGLKENGGRPDFPILPPLKKEHAHSIIQTARVEELIPFP